MSVFVKDYRDRLIPFGGVDFSQDLKEFEGELVEIYSRLELAGIKLHPCHQLIYPNQYLDEYGSMKLPPREALPVRVRPRPPHNSPHL
jgi:predicted TIM-barrel fold metal-dependent hydrolase